MALSKRAVFFTLSSILFVTAMLLVFTADFTGGPVDTRSDTIAVTNVYRQKLENTYLPMLVRHYSYQTLNSLATDAYTEGPGVFLSLPSDFQSAIMTGTYSGNPAAARNIAGFTTLPAALNTFAALSTQMGSNVTLLVNGVNIRQTGTFTALAEVNISYNLSSPDGTVRFSRDLQISEVFNLYYLPDLYYNQLGRGTINENTTLQYEDVLGNADFNATAFARSRYSVNNDSPSYFGRLTNSLAASPYGIETTIPVNVTPAGNLTSIDWQYFQGMRYNCVYNSTAMDPDIHLELTSLSLYKVNGTLIPGVGGASCPPTVTW